MGKKKEKKKWGKVGVAPGAGHLGAKKKGRDKSKGSPGFYA